MLQGNVEGKFTRKASKAVVGQCKIMDRATTE